MSNAWWSSWTCLQEVAPPTALQKKKLIWQLILDLSFIAGGQGCRGSASAMVFTSKKFFLQLKCCLKRHFFLNGFISFIFGILTNSLFIGSRCFCDMRRMIRSMPIFLLFGIYSWGCREYKTREDYIMKIYKMAISFVNAEELGLARCFGILKLVFPSLHVNKKLCLL